MGPTQTLKTQIKSISDQHTEPYWFQQGRAPPSTYKVSNDVNGVWQRTTSINEIGFYRVDAQPQQVFQKKKSKLFRTFQIDHTVAC